ncbi:MAG: hypothetical protein ABI655_07400 [Phenylobacterium sp.]
MKLPQTLGMVVALGLAACDPLPLTEFRNAGAQSVTLPSEKPVHIAWASAPPAEIRPRGRVRVLGVPQKLIVQVGPCEYLYTMPETGLSHGFGSVNRVEIVRDSGLYLLRVEREDGSYAPLTRETQPVGWPVHPVSKTCRPD